MNADDDTRSLVNCTDSRLTHKASPNVTFSEAWGTTENYSISVSKSCSKISWDNNA